MSVERARGIPAPDLVAAARSELKARIDKGVAEAEIARWRRILALVETGEAVLDPGEFPSIVAADLLAAAQSALDHRVGQCIAAADAGSVGEDGPRTKSLGQRIRELHKLRSLLLRSAIRAGAEIPGPASVGADGPGNESIAA